MYRHSKEFCRKRFFFQRDVLKKELGKYQDSLVEERTAENVPTRTSVGHSWTIHIFDTWRKKEYRAHAFLRFTISACRLRYLARTWVLSSYHTSRNPCSGGLPSGRSGARKWREEYASSRILLFFLVLDLLWSSLLLVVLVSRWP